MGVSDWVKPKRVNSARLAEVLRTLMTAQTEAQCRKVAAHFGNHTALDVAAQWVEDLRTCKENNPSFGNGDVNRDGKC